MSIQEIYNRSNGNAKTVMLYLRKVENYNDLVNETNYLPEAISKSERYYCWLNKLKEIPKCPICGKPRIFRKVNKGYFATCGDKSCKSALISKSNSESYRDWDKIQEKMKATYKEKTGYEHNMQNPEFKKQFFENYKNNHNGEPCGVQSSKSIQNHRHYLNIRKETNNNKLIEKLQDMNYEFIKFNNKNASSLKLKCKKCNHIFDVTRYYCLHKIEQHLYNFCPNCDLLQKKSLFEQSVCTEIKNIYHGEILFNNRILFGAEADIIIPEFKLAIECNGLYWHSEKFRDKYYHINKKKQIETHGYELIQIWEDIWMNNDKHKIIIDIIKQKLNIFNDIIDINNCQYIETNITKNILNFIKINSIEDYIKNERDVIITIINNNDLKGVIIFNIDNGSIKLQINKIGIKFNNLYILYNWLKERYKIDKISIQFNADYHTLNDEYIIFEPNCWYIKNIHRYKNKITNSYKIYDSGILTQML